MSDGVQAVAELGATALRGLKAPEATPRTVDPPHTAVTVTSRPALTEAGLTPAPALIADRAMPPGCCAGGAPVGVAVGLVVGVAVVVGLVVGAEVAGAVVGVVVPPPKTTSEQE